MNWTVVFDNDVPASIAYTVDDFGKRSITTFVNYDGGATALVPIEHAHRFRVVWSENKGFVCYAERFGVTDECMDWIVLETSTILPRILFAGM